MKTPVRAALASLALLTSAGLAAAADSQTAVITVDTTKAGPAINPKMYGIFLEEINHGVDGGLYAELIRNRAFEDSRPPEGYLFRNGRWENGQGFDSGFSRYGYTTNGIPFWSLVQSGEARGAIALETSGGITQKSAYCARIDVESTAHGRLGIANEGFFGIGMRQGEKYRLSLYARASKDFQGALSIRIEKADGAPCSDEGTITGLGETWKKFECSFTATSTDPKARLVIAPGARGSVWLDFVSLFPETTWKGRSNGLRADLAQLIADAHPRFVRFPGGCVVEAGSVETAYNWKLTIGPLEERQERWGPWNYRRTQGMGLFEYLQFCEDLGAEPLYVGFAGQTCIFRQREQVPMEEMGWVRDNFLDVIEYANADENSKWGALRAKAGHSAPFNLKLVEIGNENQGEDFRQRYNFIHYALKKTYPSLTYLADLSWTSRGSMRGAAFDIEDQHYYNSPTWFATRFEEYDGRDRQLPPLYLGEVAVTSNEAGWMRGNLLAALSEGIFLMGCERNADVVKMVSYAPLLGHVEGRTELTGAPPPWHAMIYFDGTRSFGTVSYHLWKLFGNNRPDQLVSSEVKFPNEKPVTISGQIGVGTWADRAEFKDIRVEMGAKVLYQSDFTKGAQGWNSRGGRWSAEEGLYRQSQTGQGFSYFGDVTWSDYTLSLKARNVGGSEGFLVVFGRKAEDRIWWNLGGWGNTQHALEHNQVLVGRPVRGKIERDRWYDVKVELQGARIRCYLDGELLHDATLPRTQKFFTVAGTDKASGELVVKAINLSDAPVTAQLAFGNAKNFNPQVQVVELKSAFLTDNNSLDEPLKVQPVASSFSASPGKNIEREFSPYSLTILKLKPGP